MTESDRFAELRKLLMEMSEDNWWGIIDLLDEWPEGTDREVAYHYADKHLRTWPADKCVAALWAWPDFPTGEPSITWKLAKRLELQEDSIEQPKDFSFLLAHPSSHNVTSLVIKRQHEESHFAFGDRELAMLAQSPIIGNIEELYIDECGITAAGLKHLADAKQPLSLKLLSLACNDIDLACAEIFAGSPQFAHLEDLNIYYSPSFGDKGLKAFVDSPYLTQLRRLELYDAGLTPAGMALFAEAENFSKLEDLGLGWNDDSEGAAPAALARSPLTSLRTLELMVNDISDGDFVHLARSPVLQNIRSLQLHNNNIGPRSIRALCESPYTTHLKELDISENPIGPDGAAALAEAPLLHNFQTLALINTHIKDAGAKALAASSILQSQKGAPDYINLANNDIGDEGALALANASFASVTSLHFYGNRISSRAREALRENFKQVTGLED